MSAAAGVTTSGGSPNALVEIQPGMWVQAVILVDQNGQYITAPSSVLTTKGDLLYENATPAPARLAIGSSSPVVQVLGVSAGLPAWVSQNYAGVFGTGTDGAVTLDGTTTYTGFSSLAGSTYTLTRDVQASSLTINNGVTLKTANYRVFCTGTITNNGTISNAGSAASGGSGGTGNPASASFDAGKNGGAGGTGVSGTGGNGVAAIFGSAGGNGGAGTSGSAGTGGGITLSGTIAAANILTLPFVLFVCSFRYAAGNNAVSFGAGGAGGGSDVATNAGGGGGAGGGIIALLAAAVVNNGTITAAGGNGAAGTGGNAGGGGGGSGGAILVYTLSAWTAGTASVAAGTHGGGSGTGSAGSDGGAGLVLNSVLK